MNDKALTSNDEKMTKNMYMSLNRYTATSYLRFNELTIQRFNVVKPLVTRHRRPILWRDS
jgi:hypothetical protein